MQENCELLSKILQYTVISNVMGRAVFESEMIFGQHRAPGARLALCDALKKHVSGSLCQAGLAAGVWVVVATK